MATELDFDIGAGPVVAAGPGVFVVDIVDSGFVVADYFVVEPVVGYAAAVVVDFVVAVVDVADIVGLVVVVAADAVGIVVGVAVVVAG